MRNYWIFVLLALSFIGCNELKNDQKIPEDKLVKVLVDIHLADGTLTAKGFKVNQDSIVIHKYYDYIFIKHETTPKLFKNTLSYYTKHSAELDLIYVKVLEQLSIIEGQVEEEIKAGKIKHKEE